MTKVVPIRADQGGSGPPDLRVARSSLADLSGRLLALLRVINREFSEPRLRRIAVKELQRLGDRQLQDIGVERHEIEALVDDMLARRRRDE